MRNTATKKFAEVEDEITEIKKNTGPESESGEKISKQTAAIISSLLMVLIMIIIIVS